MSITTLLQAIGLDFVAVLFWVALLLTIMTIITIFARLPYKITLGFLSIVAWFIFGFARLGSAIFKMFKIFDNPIYVAALACGITLLIIFYVRKKVVKGGKK